MFGGERSHLSWMSGRRRPQSQTEREQRSWLSPFLRRPLPPHRLLVGR